MSSGNSADYKVLLNKGLFKCSFLEWKEYDNIILDLIENSLSFKNILNKIEIEVRFNKSKVEYLVYEGNVKHEPAGDQRVMFDDLDQEMGKMGREKIYSENIEEFMERDGLKIYITMLKEKAHLFKKR